MLYDEIHLDRIRPGEFIPALAARLPFGITGQFDLFDGEFIDCAAWKTAATVGTETALAERV